METGRDRGLGLAMQVIRIPPQHEGQKWEYRFDREGKSRLGHEITEGTMVVVARLLAAQIGDGEPH